jgi:hypothetical protein
VETRRVSRQEMRELVSPVASLIAWTVSNVTQHRKL